MIAFARTCAAIAATSSKLEKVALVAAYLRELDDADLAPAARFFTGNPFAHSDERSLGLGGRTLVAAAHVAWGVESGELSAAYRATGDLGAALGPFVRPAADLGLFRITLTPAILYGLLVEIASASGKSAQRRRQVLCERALGACTDPLEATYVIKIVTGELRIGLREGLIGDAIAQAFDAEPSAVRRAASAAGDMGAVAVAAKHGQLDEIAIAYHAPIAFMLATPIPYEGEYQRTRDRQLDRRGQIRRHSRASARHAGACVALFADVERCRRIVSGNRRGAARTAGFVHSRRRDHRRTRRARAAVPRPASTLAAERRLAAICWPRCPCGT